MGLQGEGVKAWIRQIDKYTDGRVQIKPYWGGALLKGKEILKGVEDGIVDIGRVNPAYYPTELLLEQLLITFTQGPGDFMVGLELHNKLFEEFPEFEAEFTQYNQKTLFKTRVNNMCVTCTEPFTSFEDFKGKRIRASSSTMLNWLEGAGAIPVSIPWGDCYMALSTGQIEGVYTNIDGIHLTHLDEAAPNIFTSKSLTLVLYYLDTINLDTWDRLPKDVQEQLLAATDAAEKDYAELFTKEVDRCIAEMKEEGIVVTQWTEEDLCKFRSMPIISELQQEWVKNAEAAGIDNAAQILERTKELVKEALEK